MIALLIYLSTTVFLPVHTILAIIPLLAIRVFRLKDHSSFQFSQNEIFGYLIIGLSACILLISNTIAGPVIQNLQENSRLGNIPYVSLILLALFLGKFLSLKDLKIIQWLIVIEIIVGVAEYYVGIPTFFTNVTSISELADGEILYQRRVFGFSYNSSTLATKIVYLSAITLMQIQLRKKASHLDKFFLLTILIGLFITFNRTAMLAITVTLFIFFGRSIKNIILITLPILALMIAKWEEIYLQMTRGKNGVDYSGRDQIFDYFLNFWADNIIFGNVGSKLWWNASGFVWHAHNSYLEFLASNGLFGFCLFLIGFLLIFYKKNLLLGLPIFIFSFAQYGFLWGMSFYDVILAGILFTYSRELSEKTKNLNPNHI